MIDFIPFFKTLSHEQLLAIRSELDLLLAPPTVVHASTGRIYPRTPGDAVMVFDLPSAQQDHLRKSKSGAMYAGRFYPVFQSLGVELLDVYYAEENLWKLIYILPDGERAYMQFTDSFISGPVEVVVDQIKAFLENQP